MRLLPYLLLAGCGGSKESDDMGGGAGDTGSQVGPDTGDDGEDTGDLTRSWLLEADLALVDGAPDPASSVLRLSRRVEGTVDCVDAVGLTLVEAVAPVPHDSVLAWWSVDWDGGALSCFAADSGPGAGHALIGIGVMHPEVEALLGRLEQVTADGAAASLNAAYATLDGDERLLVYGAAGTEQAYAGQGVAASQEPLADGTWLVRAVYPFALD